jgi:plasmid stabilization system protein ParE
MNLPVVLTEDAENDFDTAANWYQEQGGLGLRFIAQIRAVLNPIGQMPELHRVIHQNIRRATVQKYPYMIYYRIRAERVEVIAVLHGRRDPSVWKNRE